jgi:hypothetical protein
VAKFQQADLTDSREMPEALFQEGSGLIARPSEEARLSQMTALGLHFLGFLLRMKRDTIVE